MSLRTPYRGSKWTLTFEGSLRGSRMLLRGGSCSRPAGPGRRSNITRRAWEGKWERAGFEVRRVSTDAVYDSPAEFVALCAE